MEERGSFLLNLFYLGRQVVTELRYDEGWRDPHCLSRLLSLRVEVGLRTSRWCELGINGDEDSGWKCRNSLHLESWLFARESVALSSNKSWNY